MRRSRHRIMLQIFFSLSFFIISTLCSNLEHDGWVNIKLEHSLAANSKEPIFTERGNITIQSLRLGQAIVNQHELTEQEQLSLKELAANNGLYRIKATVISNDDIEHSFLSTIKACMLAEAELDDRLSVSLDYSGKVIGLTVVIASTSTCEGADVPLSKLKHFTTNVYVRHSESGAIPDTATYIQKLEREREANERGEVKDNRSFFAKYWMYIIPVVIVMMASSMANPDAPASGAAR